MDTLEQELLRDIAFAIKCETKLLKGKLTPDQRDLLAEAAAGKILNSLSRSRWLFTRPSLGPAHAITLFRKG